MDRGSANRKCRVDAGRFGGTAIRARETAAVRRSAGGVIVAALSVRRIWSRTELTRGAFVARRCCWRLRRVSG